MHEVVNGLKDVDDIELSFVPAGAYNDFARGFSIKNRSDAGNQKAEASVNPNLPFRKRKFPSR